MVKVPLKKNFDHFMPHQNLQCDQKAWIKSCPKSTENAAPEIPKSVFTRTRPILDPGLGR